MGEVTKIEWTDHTFNPWIGCTKVAPECANCYAEQLMAKRWKKVEWGDKGTRSVTSDSNWKMPIKWNKSAEKEGVLRRVFCASLADVFEDRSELEYWRSGLFDLIYDTPWLDWLLLTKRPGNIKEMWPADGRRRGNCWLGTSVGCQESTHRIDSLLQCRDLSPVLFLSVEPLLGPVDLSKWMSLRQEVYMCPVCRKKYAEERRNGRGVHLDCRSQGHLVGYLGGSEIDWVIVGGESGPHARRCDVGWIRSIVKQCKEAEVPCFVKQLGSRPKGKELTEVADPKGGDWDEWPEDFRVREFPKVRA